MNAFFSQVLISAVSLPGVWLAANASEKASEAIAVRDGALIATLHAEGAQIYECKQNSEKSPSQLRVLTWQFREPVATLISAGSGGRGRSRRRSSGSVLRKWSTKLSPSVKRTDPILLAGDEPHRQKPHPQRHEGDTQFIEFLKLLDAASCS